MRRAVFSIALALALGSYGCAATPVAAQLTSAPALVGSAAYEAIGFGPATSGAGTATLLGAPAQYLFGQSAGLPVLRCDYVGQSYHAELTGDFGLQATTPGNVVAVMILGGTSITSTITNGLAGTPGASWDAWADITCASVGTNSATVLVGGELGPYQAVGSIYAFTPFNRGIAPVAITTVAGAFTFDLQRTFTANNAMRIQHLRIVWVR